MPRFRLLRNFEGLHEGFWHEQFFYYDCNQPEGPVLWNTVIKEEGASREPEQRYPAYINQWDDAGTQKNAWADNQSGFQPVIGTIATEYNLYTSNSFFVRLHQPIVITPSSGNDGYAHFRAWGGENSNYTYIVNDVATGGTNYNQISFDGKFTDLPPDDYYLTVGTNPQTQTISLIDYPFTVPAAETYGVRFTLTFQDYAGNDVKVDILRKNYSGTAEEVCMGGNPLVVTTDMVGDDFLSGLMPMDMVAEFVQSYDGQYDDLFTAPNDYWKLRVTRGTTILTGLIMPEQCYIEHQDNPITLTINAVAGLSNMGEEPIEGWGGTMTMIEAVAAIQTLYNHSQYPIREFVGLREAGDASTYIWETFRRYKIGMHSFNGKTPKDAINMLLSTFNCSMTHSYDDYIQITRVDLVTYRDGTLQGAYYKPWGEFVNYLTTSVDPIDIRCDGSGEGNYINGNQGWSYIPKVSEVTVEAEYNDGADHNLEIDLALWHQMDTEGTTTNISIDTDLEGDSFIKLQGVAQGRQTNWNGRQKMGTSSLRFTGWGLRMSFGYKYKVNDDSNVTSEPLIGENVAIMLMYGDKSINRTNSIDNGYGYLHAKEAELADTWEENKIEANMTTERGVAFQGEPIRVWLYGIWQQLPKTGGTFQPDYAGYKDLSLKVILPENHEELNTPFTLSIDSDGNRAAPISLSFCDAPDQYGYSSEVAGVVVKETELLTFTWQGYNQSAAVPLKEFHALVATQLRGKNIRRLEGSVYTGFPGLLSVLYDPTIGGGTFAIQRFSYDFKRRDLEFSALELTGANGGALLLEDDGTYLYEDDDKIKLQ